MKRHYRQRGGLWLQPCASSKPEERFGGGLSEFIRSCVQISLAVRKSVGVPTTLDVAATLH